MHKKIALFVASIVLSTILNVSYAVTPVPAAEPNALAQSQAEKNIGEDVKLLMRSGNKKAALKMLSDAEAFSADDEGMMIAIAFAWVEIGETKRGRALYDHIRVARPHPDIKWHLRYADFLAVTGSTGELRDELMTILKIQNQLPVGTAFSDVPDSLHISRILADIGEYELAQQQVDSLIAAHPNETYLLYDGWKTARRSENTAREIDYLKKLVIAEPAIRPSPTQDAVSVQGNIQRTPATAYENIGIDEFGSEKKIQRDWKEKKLASLIDRRSRWFSSAIDVRSRSGTAGLSEFHSVEIPLEYKTPWHVSDEVFFRADLVKLDAGSVASTNSNFGSMLLCQPTCASTQLQQTARGVSFTAGYQRANLSADIGTTPRNFAVTNIVGGIQQKGDLGQFGYSLEASRRPITTSLLSYAGSIDPNTGQVWGGVVATGGRLGLSLDAGKTFGFWSSLGWHNLTGRNVQSNRRFQLMAGEQWRVINEENRRLTLGLTGAYWNLSENAGEYTFGHGGYFSPHTYLSLSLPLTYVKRSPRFSYLLQAAISASRSQTKAADFFPTNSTLQGQALLTPTTPTYTGGSSSGTGYLLRGAWEYQVQPKFFIGGLLAIERSQSYAPNQVLLYIRYSFDHPGAQPVFLPPEPIEPSSQFR